MIQLGQTEITEGCDFEIENAKICVKHRIGEGNSAKVYLASKTTQDGAINVAVKVLRPEMAMMFKGEFIEEARTIQTLMSLYHSKFPGSPLPVPEYFAGVLDAQFPFFIEEFIEGKTLKQELVENGRLPEEEAMRLAAQVGRILVFLHNDIQKCYGDIKFDNFYIVSGAGKRQLKILDWNILVDLTYNNIQKDLLYVSTYLFYILTGDSIKLDWHTLSINRPPESFESFKSLSVAAQQFFQKAVNPEIGCRFQKADDWLAEVEKHLNWWQQEKNALLNDARDLFTRVQTEPTLFNQVYEVQKQAGIAMTRGVIGADALLNETNQWMNASNLVERIKTHWNAGDIDTAILVFQNVVNKEQYRKDAALVFWGVGAKISKKLGSSSSDLSKKLYDAIETRLKDEYKSAANQFKELADQPSIAVVLEARNTVKSLEDEAHLQDLIAQAQSQGIRVRNETLIQANACYARLPGDLQKLVLENHNLPEMLKRSEQQAQALNQAISLAAQAKQTSDADEAAQLYKQALAISPDRSQVISDLKELVIGYFKKGQYSEAQRLARLPRQAGISDAWLEEIFTAAIEIQALKSMFGQVSLDILVVHIQSYLERHSDSADTSPFFCKDFFVFFQRVFDSSLAEHNFKAARSLYHLLKMYFQGDVVNNMKSSLTSAQQQACNDLIGQALEILNSSQLDEDVMGKAETIIDAAAKDEYRDETKVRAAKGLLESKKRDYETNKRKKEAIETQARSLQTQLTQSQGQFEILEQGVVLCPPENRQVYYQEMGRILGTYLVLLEELKKLGLNENDISSWQIWGAQKTSHEILAGAQAFLEEQAKAKKIRETKEPPKTPETPPAPPKRFRMLRVGIVALVIVIVLIAAAFAWRSGIFNPRATSGPVASPTVVSSGATGPQSEPPTTTPVPATATSAPTATTVATVPTPSLSPTSITMSKFAITAMPSKAPALAELTGPGPFYLIDDSDAKFEGKWTKQESATSGLNGSFEYIDGYGNLNEASAVWTMDLPLLTGGSYEVFILDLASNSGTTLPISYKVLKQSGDEVAPVAGSGSIKLLKSAAQADGKDVWRSIGIYKLDAGEIPSLRLDIPKGYLSSGEMVGADSVLFIPLPPIKMDTGPGKDLADKKQVALMVIDDDHAVLDPTEGWQTTKSENVWNSSFHQIDLKDKTVSAKWIFALPTGDYNLKMFIPQELTARVDFSITLDGQPVKGLETLNIPENSGTGGTHYPAAGWKISVSEASKGQVVIEMKSADKTTGKFACDAVVVLAAQ